MECKKDKKGRYTEMSIFWINVFIVRHNCTTSEAIDMLNKAIEEEKARGSKTKTNES